MTNWAARCVDHLAGLGLYRALRTVAQLSRMSGGSGPARTNAHRIEWPQQRTVMARSRRIIPPRQPQNAATGCPAAPPKFWLTATLPRISRQCTARTASHSRPAPPRLTNAWPGVMWATCAGCVFLALAELGDSTVRRLEMSRQEGTSR